MIEQLDRAIERFFRTRAPLPESTAAISFETPDQRWGAARTRPTVSLFLWEIIQAPTTLRTGMEQRVTDNGNRQRRPVTPIVDLHYLVTAWATEPRDEHQLLGILLQCTLAHGRIPDDALPPALAGKRCGLGLAPYDARPPGEIWTSLGGSPRAAINLEVSLPLEVFEWQEVAPPAESIVANVDPTVPAPEPEPSDVVVTRRRVNGAMVMEGTRSERSDSSNDS